MSDNTPMSETESVGMSLNSPNTAESGLPDYRLWWEQAQRRRAEIEKVLDAVLGTEEGDGAGAGLVADVQLAIAVAWEAGYRQCRDDERHTAQTLILHRTPNPYRTRPTSPAVGTTESVGPTP